MAENMSEGPTAMVFIAVAVLVAATMLKCIKDD